MKENNKNMWIIFVTFGNNILDEDERLSLTSRPKYSSDKCEKCYRKIMLKIFLYMEEGKRKIYLLIEIRG